MSTKPISFIGPMVRALVEGRKTQTRRVLKTQPPSGHELVGLYAPGLTAVFNPAGSEHRGDPDQDVSVPLPYMPRDLLWVQEAWCHFPDNAPDGMGELTYYQAEPDNASARASEVMKRNGIDWQPADQMPREFSRITLELTHVRVERLQDIRDKDAIAEGISKIPYGLWHWNCDIAGTVGYRSATNAFLRLWGDIYGHDGPASVSANPWVVVATFIVHHRNVDAMPGAKDLA